MAIYQKHGSGSSSDDIAKTLCQSGILNTPLENVRDVVDDMLNAASRYKHFEKALGSSVALVLGNKISERS
jgi:hypothetical protein